MIFCIYDYYLFLLKIYDLKEDFLSTYFYVAQAATWLFLFIYEYLSSIGWMSTSWFYLKKRKQKKSSLFFVESLLDSAKANVYILNKKEATFSVKGG